MILNQKIDTKNSLKYEKNLNVDNIIRNKGHSAFIETGAIKNEKKLISEINLNNKKRTKEKQENKIKKEETIGFHLTNQSQNIMDIIEKELEFKTLQQKGLNAIMNHQNINNYLLKLFFNNDLISPNQLFQYNNNMNYICNTFPNIFNNFGNSIYNNSFQYKINQKKNNEPGNYEITLEIPTNQPNIKKITKISINTSFINDNEIIKQNNNETTEGAINIDDIISGKEKRTVIRLIPIPNKYSSLEIIELIDKYLSIKNRKGIIKAIYTPFSLKKRKNFGFCFIMLTNPKCVIDFYNKINGVVFGKKKCNKPCKVIWADIQGNDFLEPKDPHRRPIIFKI